MREFFAAAVLALACLIPAVGFAQQTQQEIASDKLANAQVEDLMLQMDVDMEEDYKTEVIQEYAECKVYYDNTYKPQHGQNVAVETYLDLAHKYVTIWRTPHVVSRDTKHAQGQGALQVALNEYNAGNFANSITASNLAMDYFTAAWPPANTCWSRDESSLDNTFDAWFEMDGEDPPMP